MTKGPLEIAWDAKHHLGTAWGPLPRTKGPLENIWDAAEPTVHNSCSHLGGGLPIMLGPHVPSYSCG